MKRLSLIALSVLTLAGCVSQESQQKLTALQTQCAAGDQDACTASSYQGQANQQELQANANVAAGVGAALLGAIVVAQPGFIDGQPVTYVPGGYMVGGRRYAGRPAVVQRGVGVRQVAAHAPPQKKTVFR